MPVSTRDNRSVAAPVERIERSKRTAHHDQLAIEEPLEIRLDDKSVAVVMRTPGHDEELAVGFLLTEGILHKREELVSVGPRRINKRPDLGNVINVVSGKQVNLKKRGWQRNFVSASSCGLCGKLTIESVRLQAPSVADDELRVSATLLRTLPDRMRSAQDGFDETGGVHAAGLFDVNGDLLVLREDIGRHNAVDKVVGASFLENALPLRGRILLVSGRASFEIVQKALMARIPFVAAVSAASSLAVDLSRELGMTLVGFLRGETMNIYTGSERVGEP
ncbi:MAG TPA: formate dehydrogenase accessory sulfurtransferase FdhD [Vicinamibacteria bacterium]|nr:formate dehydrogenase accessory sulfurtransferase FdhD [Vicinamibacteria bacterium]